MSSWGTRKRNYDTALFEKAVRLFVEAGDEVAHTETYLTDRTDFVRQLLANRADEVYARMTKAVGNNDKIGFEKNYRQFEQMLMQQDSLLNCNPHFSLSTWLNHSIKYGKSKTEKAISLRNAKTQISYWGPNQPATDLHDYAHKEWGGLLGTLYLQRWQLFAKEMSSKLDGQDIVSNYFEIEKKWADNPALYPMTHLSPQQLDVLIERIINH